MMAKKMKKLFSLILALSMVMSLVSVVASAEGAAFGCGKEEHAHVEECYEKQLQCVKHVCAEGCAVPCELTLTCSDVSHEHDETCYEVHTHGDDCYVSVATCGYEEHGHSVDCLANQADKDAVADMIAELEGIPSLREMQDARTTTFALYAQDKYETAAEASKAYDAYVAESFAKREIVQQAYNAFPEGLKRFIPAEKLARLTDTLSAYYNSLTKAVPVITDESYKWFLTGSGVRYERSNHANLTNSWCQPYVMIDGEKYQGTTWRNTPGDFVPGVSNYDVVYCCDNGQAANNTFYKRINLEDSEYYSDATAQHIRAIVMNSYPFVSLEKMQENLVELGMDSAFAASLDYDDVIAAVSWAIWYHANGDVSQLEYLSTCNYGANSSAAIRNHQDLVWQWWSDYTGSVKANKKHYTADIEYKVETLAKFLANLEKVAATKNQVVINSLEVVGAPVLKDETAGIYEVALKITLNSGGSGVKDNLKITVSNNGAAACEVAIETEKTEYIVTVAAQSGDEIKAEVSGTQHLPSGVYFYVPKPADTNSDGTATSREVSQNMVGVAMGDTAVYAVDSLTFEMEEEDTVAGSLGLKKVNESGETLTGAEFALAVDLDGDNVADPFKTYTVDANGEVTIENLMAGKTYQLIETKAPAGYDALDKAITFTVAEDGTDIEVYNLPNGVTCESGEDEIYILTVENCPTPPPYIPPYNPPVVNPPVVNPPAGGEEELPEGDVPTTDAPVEDEIFDEDVPLAGADGEEEIFEEDVPLADVPATGDMTALWMAASAVSAVGLFLVGKKSKDEE